MREILRKVSKRLQVSDPHKRVKPVDELSLNEGDAVFLPVTSEAVTYDGLGLKPKLNTYWLELDLSRDNNSLNEAQHAVGFASFWPRTGLEHGCSEDSTMGARLCCSAVCTVGKAVLQCLLWEGCAAVCTVGKVVQ